MPKRGADHSLAVAHGIGERSGGDLLAFQIRDQVDVGRSELTGELVPVHECVIEADVGRKAKARGQPHQFLAVGLAMMRSDVGVGRTQHEVGDIRERPHHAGQGADRRLNALVGRQQPEGEDQRAPRQTKA